MSLSMPSGTPTTSAPNTTQIQQTQMKVMYLGLAYTLGLPLVLFAVAAVVRPDGGTSGGEPWSNRVMFYALLAVALMEIPTALFLKKVMLKPLPTSEPGQPIPTTGFVFSRYLIIFNLAAACSVYGLVWHILGGTLAEFALFALIGLVIFRLTRPTTEFFFSLFGVRPAIE